MTDGAVHYVTDYFATCPIILPVEARYLFGFIPGTPHALVLCMIKTTKTAGDGRIIPLPAGARDDHNPRESKENVMAYHVQCYNHTHQHQSKGRPSLHPSVCSAGPACLFNGIIKEGDLFTWTRPSSRPPGMAQTPTEANALKAKAEDDRVTPVPFSGRYSSNAPALFSSKSMLEMAARFPTDILLAALARKIGPRIPEE